jgi:hypothetical protein
LKPNPVIDPVKCSGHGSDGLTWVNPRKKNRDIEKTERLVTFLQQKGTSTSPHRRLLIQPTNTNPEKPGRTDKSHKERENHKQIIQKNTDEK